MLLACLLLPFVGSALCSLLCKFRTCLMSKHCTQEALLLPARMKVNSLHSPSISLHWSHQFVLQVGGWSGYKKLNRDFRKQDLVLLLLTGFRSTASMFHMMVMSKLQHRAGNTRQILWPCWLSWPLWPSGMDREPN